MENRLRCKYPKCGGFTYVMIFWAGADTSFDWYGSLAGAVCSGIKAGLQVFLSKSDRRYRKSQEPARIPGNLHLYYHAFSNWKKYVYTVVLLSFALWSLKKLLRKGK
nr:unnamed protein product [Callosobruchus analis]